MWAHSERGHYFKTFCVENNLKTDNFLRPSFETSVLSLDILYVLGYKI